MRRVCVRRVYPRGTRRLVTCHARCHGGARICQRTYERDALQGRAWYHGQIIRVCRQKYDDSRPTAGVMGGSLQQPPAAMLEIGRRHSVMLHGSCIASFEIERATMNGHDQRGPSRASLHGLRSEVCHWFDSKENRGEISQCFAALPAGYRVVEKKTDSGPDFRLTRSRHPVRRGGALVRRPATAGPPGATLKPICACFMRRGCRYGPQPEEKAACALHVEAPGWSTHG